MGDALNSRPVDCRVLVVEDDAIVGLGLVAYLKELGATVDWSTTVDGALAIINDNARIDLAIVDLNLHGTLSTPVISRLLDRKIPTALCTGYDVDSAQSGCEGLPRLEKPFIRRKVRDLLAGYL